MTDAQTILNLIETVDPADTDKIQWIDIQVAFFLENKNCPEWKGIKAIFDLDMKLIPSYTRSRDALKAIRPEGWEFDLNVVLHACEYSATLLHKKHIYIRSCWLKTEELAELHAIIQAIAYERGQQ